MDLEMSHIVIWPISMVAGSTMIYITSQVVDKGSIINVMLNLRNHNNNQLYYASKVYSTQCPKCRVYGFTDCEHDVFMPAYFDKRRADMVNALMKGYQEVWMREIRNETVEESVKKCFDFQQLSLINHPDNEYYQDTIHDEVYVVIDPNAGGVTSRYAIISFVTDKIKMPNSSETRMSLIILGAENCEDRDPIVHRNVLEEHITHITKNITGCSRSLFVIMPESNFALESSHIAETMAHTFLPNQYEIIQEDRDRVGWRTDQETKAVGTRLLQSLVGSNSLRLHRSFFTSPSGENIKKYSSKFAKAGTITPDYYQMSIQFPDSEARETIRNIAKFDVRQEIISQLGRWSQEKSISPITGEVKTKYHGKFNGKPDDMALCIISAPLLIKKRQATVNAKNMLLQEIKKAREEMLKESDPEAYRRYTEKPTYHGYGNPASALQLLQKSGLAGGYGPITRDAVTGIDRDMFGIPLTSYDAQLRNAPGLHAWGSNINS